MFTIKSISDEGIYYLVNGWDRHKAFWKLKENLKPDMLFKSAARRIGTQTERWQHRHIKSCASLQTP